MKCSSLFLIPLVLAAALVSARRVHHGKRRLSISSDAAAAAAALVSSSSSSSKSFNETLQAATVLPELAAVATKTTMRGSTSGRATWYGPDDGRGDCGSRIETSDMAVALATVDYARGENCGKKINVYYEGATITVTVLDECPGCDKGNIDLTRGAFAKFAKFEVGELAVTWEYAS